MRRMRSTTLSLLCGISLCAPAGAQNLLVNPDFDEVPFDNGWTTVGTGSVSELLGTGEPAPSVALDASGTESVALEQCRPVSADTPYAFIARTYTSFASGASTNAVRLRWFALEGCSNEISSFELTAATYPQGSFSRRFLYWTVSPATAQSARVELEVVANGTPEEVFFDAIYLPEPGSVGAGLAVATALFLVRRRR
jgi:hypothetical protein